ncbi:MAG: PfkB family carbohydrate kinase, partial [Gemmataceae bacterium]
LLQKFGLAAVAGIVRQTPLVWRNTFGAVGYAGGQFYETPLYDVEIVDRLGTGDAFAAGLIDGLLRGDFATGLRTGAAMGALQHSTPGDLPQFRRDEVEAALAGAGLRIQR